MNEFDANIIRFFNTFAHRNEVLDHVIWFMTQNVLVIGGASMAMFWYAWIRYGSTAPEKREILVFGLFAGIFALFVARALAFSLPFRLRPFHDASLHFQLPYGADPQGIMGWSAFPSDRAVLFFCQATILSIVSRPLGAVAICHALFVICLPTIYVGIHYPSDLIVGALLGICIARLSLFARLRADVTRTALHWLSKNPAAFYTFLFLCTFEIAELF